jgi:hypothetical protein
MHQAQRPIGQSSVQLASKTGHFLGYFQRLSRVRAIESSRLMERAMGIEPTSEAWEASILPLYDARSAYNLANVSPRGKIAELRPKMRVSGDSKQKLVARPWKNRTVCLWAAPRAPILDGGPRLR